jgi:hypothetical protein
LAAAAALYTPAAAAQGGLLRGADLYVSMGCTGHREKNDFLYILTIFYHVCISKKMIFISCDIRVHSVVEYSSSATGCFGGDTCKWRRQEWRHGCARAAHGHIVPARTLRQLHEHVLEQLSCTTIMEIP